MIELPITQNVIAEYKLAPTGKRIFAQLLDLVCFFLFWLGSSIILTSLKWFGIFNYIGFYIFVSFPAYYCLFESLNKGQTLGKMALGTRVVNEAGEILTAAETLLRAILLYIDLLLSLGVVGCILITATKKRQRLGDLAAGTLVVETVAQPSKSLLDNYSEQTLYDRTATYTGVRFLKEDDVMLLKETINRFDTYKNYATAQAISIAYQKICDILGVKPHLKNISEQKNFLTEIIKDYIVTTR